LEPADPLAFLAGEATEILRIVGASDIEELEIEHAGYRLSVRRSLADGPDGTDQPAASPVETADDIAIIASPVVGWFRRSATPDGPPLVEVGATIEVGQRLAVIEAVQVVHDVIADCAGTLAEILVEDGDGVGYGQPLFRVQP
jgi:acetyl-CoA carboxylase biotin carboxyl carrier protein